VTIRTLTIEPGQAPRDLDLIKDRAPYFFAVGINAEKYTATELYQLEAIITDDPAVQMCWRNKVSHWKQLQPRTNDFSLEGMLSCVPPKRLLLEAIRELSPVRKAEIRRVVLEKKAALAS
jgi:hypothetical protein